MNHNEKPDILSRIRNMKLRKEFTVLLAFFVMISTSYVMIHPGEALNNSTARSFMFFNEEEGMEETAAPTEVPDINALLDADRDSGVEEEVPAEENVSEEEQSVSETAESTYSTEPVQTPAETVVPTLEPTATPENTATVEAEGTPVTTAIATAESESVSDPFITASAEPETTGTPEATETPEATLTPEPSPSATPETEDEDLYPAIDFGEITPLEADGTETEEDIRVVIKAPEGAFPEGTTVKVVLVRDTEILNAIEKAAKDATEDNVAVKQVQAVDITFTDKDGNEVQPAKPIAVSFKSELVKEAENTTVVHVEQDENKEKITDTKTVDTIAKPEDSDLVDSIEDNEVVIEADSFSVYGIVGTELVTEFTLSNPDGEDVTYLVTVTYGPEAEIPEDSKLEVKEYVAGSNEYDTAEEKLLGAKLNGEDNGWFYIEEDDPNYEEYINNVTENGLTVFDISIIGPDGVEIEPKAPVTVKIEMKELPDDTDKSILENSMELKHFVESEDDTSVENVANTNNVYGVSGGEISVSENNVTAEFDIDSFSLFAFTWGTRNANVIVHYVDEAGNDLTGTQSSNVTAANSTTYNFSTYEGGISGYTFKEAYINNLTGEKEIVTGFRTGGSSSNTLTFRNGDSNGSSYTTPFNVDVYFVYSKNDYPGGGDGGGSMDAPRTEKLLDQAKDENGHYDGTYTISLSVTGQQQSTPVNTKANVVVVYDSSNSMSDSKQSYKYTASTYGRYGLVNGQYPQLYYRSGTDYWGNPSYSQVGNNDNHTEVFTRSGTNPWYTYTPYTGTRYTRTTVTQTRDEIAKDAVTGLATALLANNTTANPDMVELAFVDFGTMVNSVNGGSFTLNGSTLTPTVGKTTNLNTFLGWLNGVVIPDTSSSVNDNLGGTDWEEALKIANLYSFNDNDPTYIVFVSDGDPTYRVSRNGHNDGQGNQQGTQGLSRTSNGRTVTVWGSGSNDPNNYNQDAAVTEAKNILTANKKLYTVGAFIDSGTKMQQLGGFFYNAAEKEDLEEAFEDIVSSITRSLTYANVEITDGITDMTATTFVAGELGNFKYYKDGVEWTAEQMAAEGASGATTTTDTDGNKQVVWNLGQNYKLEKNVKYTLTFTVWPKQEAYDLLAALNNGILTWGNDFTYTKPDGSTATIPYSEYKDQIIKNGNTYTVLTNTDAGITYQVVQEEDGVETGRTDGSADITNPTNGMGLDESHLDVRKEWNDTLDPQQLLNLLDSEPDYKVVLHIRNDNNEYVPVTITPVVTRGADGKAISATWPTEKVYIAPGVMLSVAKATAKGINTDNYKKVTYNGTTYVILESGHDYSIDEHNTDYHFELRAETYHPMVVDGTVCNVSFTYDDDGAIDGITAIDTTNTGTIVATNELRAGINLRKIVVDSEGEEIYPENEYFYLQVSLKDKDGNSIRFADYQDPEKDAPLHDSPYITDAGEESTVSVGWNTYPIWYNIYYDAYDDLDIVGSYIPEGSQYYQRSDGMVVQDGGLVRIKAGDVIRLANVPIGTQFSLKEINVPAGYGFKEYKYKVGKATTEWTTVTDINTGYSTSAVANQSYYFTFKNEQQTSDMIIIKTDENGNAITSATDTAIFKLTKNTKSDGTGTWENATATSGIAADGTVTVNTTNGINLAELKDGLYKLQETKSPDGYIIITNPVYFKLNGGTIKFVKVEGSGSSTVVTEIDTPDGYTVVAKTEETPVTLKIANTPGQELPMTGGTGTLPYTLGGITVMLTALMYGFRMRRRERRLN